MDLLQLIEAQPLPIATPIGVSFLQHIGQVFNNFEQALRNLTSTDELSERVRSRANECGALIKGLRKTVALFWCGRVGDAYKAFTEAVTTVSDEIACLGTLEDISPVLKRLYRARISSDRLLTRSDLFHLPFEKRQTVRAYRYSVPGLPCLYLADSVDLCWEELNRPRLRQLYVARFEASEKIPLKLLDLRWRPTDLLQVVRGSLMTEPPNLPLRKFLMSNVVCWPLLAACSVPCACPDGAFRPEYIIPQFVLQWIAAHPDRTCDGVRYFSSRVDSAHVNGRPLSNFVLPAREIADVGHCGWLKRAFRVSEPLKADIALGALVRGEASKRKRLHHIESRLSTLECLSLD